MAGDIPTRHKFVLRRRFYELVFVGKSGPKANPASGAVYTDSAYVHLLAATSEENGCRLCAFVGVYSRGFHSLQEKRKAETSVG